MQEDAPEVQTIDAPLTPAEEERLKIGDLSDDERRRREAGLVAAESGKPVEGSQYWTAPVLDREGHEVTPS
jgi:hypothetical protein